MSARLWWRFRFLQEYPHRWALLHHPRVGHDQRLDCAVEFFKLRKCSCCRTNEFCEKVWKTFWDGSPTTSAWRLLGDVDFQRMLRAFVRRGFSFCNMRMERLLALINRACGSDMPDAERFVAMSLLAQMMKAHRSLGRADPVIASRAELLQAGVPLRAWCKPAKLQRRRDCGALFAYVNQMQQENISAGFHQFTAAENYEFRRGCSERFASLSKAEQKPFADKAQHLLAQRDAAADEAKPADVKYSDEWETFSRVWEAISIYCHLTTSKCISHLRLDLMSRRISVSMAWTATQASFGDKPPTQPLLRMLLIYRATRSSRTMFLAASCTQAFAPPATRRCSSWPAWQCGVCSAAWPSGLWGLIICWRFGTLHLSQVPSSV